MGRIISLTGPSGAGKTSVAQVLIARLSGAYTVKSHTTRPKRVGEVVGEYEHVTGTKFDELKPSFLWSIGHGDHKYGIQRQYLERVLETDGVYGIMILVPNVLETLRDFVYTKTKRLSDFVPFFIEREAPPVVLARLIASGIPECAVHKRYEEMMRRSDEEDWEVWAKSPECTIPFSFVKNDGAVEETVSNILAELKFRVHT